MIEIEPALADRTANLCKQLTDELRGQGVEREHSSIFVGAYSTRAYSRYFALDSIFQSDSVLNMLRSNIKDLDESDAFRVGFRFGSAVRGLQRSQRAKEEAVRHLLDVGKAWGFENEPNIFSELDHQATWPQKARSFVKTLESVQFSRSVLSRNFSNELFVLRTEKSIFGKVETRARSDTLFAYGVACEAIVFPRDRDFHFCWLQSGTSADEEFLIAICLWSSPEATKLVAQKKLDFERLIREGWTGERVVEQKSTDRRSRDVIAVTISSWIDDTVQAIKRASDPDARKQIHIWALLKESVVHCQDRAKLSSVEAEIRKSTGTIATQIDPQPFLAALELVE